MKFLERMSLSDIQIIIELLSEYQEVISSLSELYDHDDPDDHDHDQMQYCNELEIKINSILN